MKLKHRWKYLSNGVHESDNGLKIHINGYAVINGKTYSVNDSRVDDYFIKCQRILSRKSRRPRLRALLLWAERMDLTCAHKP